MTAFQPHLPSKMFSFIFSFHSVGRVIESRCTQCRFSFHIFLCCYLGRMNFSPADLKVEMAFCSFLVFLLVLYSSSAFSFASFPPLNPKYFIHDHYLLQGINTFLYYLKRLQRKSVKVWVFFKKEKKKKIKRNLGFGQNPTMAFS